jgi:ferredoxin/flavodoxin---NADP+ reductase
MHESGQSATSDGANLYRVAVVGAGPSGCYVAQAMRKQVPGVEITLIDALPTPFGLVRHGVAPDHQGAKAVTRQFERLLEQPDVSFIGNVRVGADLPLDVLNENFHAVVLATGLGADRAPAVPLDSQARVVGAGEVLRLLNSDPDVSLRTTGRSLESLGEEIAILGTGNVAVDVARILTKTEAELVHSDIDDEARRALVPGRIRRIHIIGRCEERLAKWDASMVKELAAVADADLHVVDGGPVTEVDDGVTRIEVRFLRILDAIEAHDGRTRLVLHHDGDDSRVEQLDVDTVITAIGFEAAPSGPLQVPTDHDGLLIRVGGAASGRLGNLADNRRLSGALAREVAELLAVGPQDARPGRAGLNQHLPSRSVDFAGWKRIDAAETSRARPDRCRTKFTTRAQLLDAAEQPEPIVPIPGADTATA